MADRFEVVVGAGSFRSADERAVRFPHRWTPEGVTVESDFTGAHLLHLAAAGCVLNDVYREAAGLGIEISGVRVAAVGSGEPSRHGRGPRPVSAGGALSPLRATCLRSPA